MGSPVPAICCRRMVGLQMIRANVTKRAYLVVEHKIPAIHDKPSNGVEHDKLSLLTTNIVYVPIGRLDQVMELVSSTTTSSTLVDRSDLAAVVSPVQKRLPLARPAKRIARLTVLSDLSGAPSKRLPALDLTPIFLKHPPPHEVSSIWGCSARCPCVIWGSWRRVAPC